jgi:steroid 5-alpha reductase family enzyme
MAEDPLLLALIACAILAVACWLLSVTTGNYSQVDRLWSIAPPLYVCWFAGWAGFADRRLDLMAALAILWGARLTWNFARKGGYRPGDEDYRWPELRRRLGPLSFQVLNATFIAPFQNGLLLLLALPAYVAWQARGVPLGWLDALASAAFLLLWTGEVVADQQQWRFQQDKKERRARAEPVPAEFLTSGLFRYSRHPNFFCEQGMWWAFYLFSVAASGNWINASIAGPVLLTLLFQGSTRLTEDLTLRKYPDYREYQRTTPRLVPSVPRAASAARTRSTVPSPHGDDRSVG